LSANPPTVSLAWTNNATNPAATTFLVQRASDPNFTQNVVNLPAVAAPAVSTIDSTVTTHATYYYRVRAENAIAYSVWSATATATTAGQLPAAPTNLAVVGATRTSLTVRWTNQASSLQGFHLERSLFATGPWNQPPTFPRYNVVPNPLPLVGDTVSYTNSNLLRNVTYWYRVRAYNADGTSAWVGPVSGRTLP
jgi:hypothetical protein